MRRSFPQNTRFACGALPLFLGAWAVAEQKPFTAGGTGEVPPPMPSGEATQPTAAASTPTGPIDNFFNQQIPEVIRAGKFNLNVRLRYEQVDSDNQPPFTKDSYAPTIRTRFGYTTTSLYGFQGMIEGVNVSVLGPEHNYNAAGSNGQPQRPPVADPPLTRIDQAWVAYSYTNYIQAKVGEQQIFLDNRRFIADVGWRQNIQTYEAAQLRSEPIDHLNLYYGYSWRVHRVFGNVPGLPPANRDYDSRSHFINASYSGWKYGTFAGYAYLLDLRNDGGNTDSCATYGGYFAGTAPVAKLAMLDYRAELAWQQQYAQSPLRYDAFYYNLEAGANIKPVAFGAGYELLGSGANSGIGGGRASFRTPLATLHAFNGWADVFVNTPANGLQDLYAYFQVTLPGKIPLRFVYHKFDADYGGSDFGQEFDVLATRKFGKYWNVLLEYANYVGRDMALPAVTGLDVNIQKFWAAVEFNF